MIMIGTLLSDEEALAVVGGDSPWDADVEIPNEIPESPLDPVRGEHPWGSD